MNWMTSKMDDRLRTGILLIEQPITSIKEVYFQHDGKRLFLASITEAGLKRYRVNMIEEWLEEVIINLPPYEDLIKIAQNEGERVQEQMRAIPCPD
ncbi:hypothetical protein ABEW34_17205 [Paenibacillus algorifonticola]|uniref:hypothetical protein n=1 Tax=Paenibacillus algorifonticola TaxID=684063 RepID=UPI003D2A7BEB